MTPIEVLAAAADRGMELWRVGDVLRYRPKSAMTPDLAALLTGNKASLMVLLAEGPPDRVASMPDAEDEPSVGSGDMPLTSDRWPGDGWPDVETIAMDEVELCPTCDVIDHWQDATGAWHCRSCEPPKWNGSALLKVADRLREKAARRQRKKTRRANSC